MQYNRYDQVIYFQPCHVKCSRGGAYVQQRQHHGRRPSGITPRFGQNLKLGRSLKVVLIRLLYRRFLVRDPAPPGVRVRPRVLQ